MEKIDLSIYEWHDALLLNLRIERINEDRSLLVLDIYWPDETRNEIIFEYHSVDIQMNGMYVSYEPIDRIAINDDIINSKDYLLYTIYMSTTGSRISVCGKVIGIQ